MHLVRPIDQLMHSKRILKKISTNLNRLYAWNSWELQLTCWALVVIALVVGIFLVSIFFVGFFHETKLARKPHRTFGYQNYDWNLKTPKNWACAATPKTLTEIRLPLLVSLSLALFCSFFFALPPFLSFLLRALRWVQFGLTFGFVLISFSFERLDAPQLANWIWIWSWVWSGVWVSLWVEIECYSRSS